ncbi:MAG: UvrD-helicase domain-containing protein, partial [Gammaproteobacteria bacterium]|nr:UvrD-helicase domain-containing protein [Gammaproteobacteria bacterium]
MVSILILLCSIIGIIILWWRQKQAWQSASAKLDALEIAQADCEHFLSGGAYARDSQRRILVDRCTGELSLTRTVTWRLFSSASQKRQAARVAAFAENSTALTRDANARFLTDESVRFKEIFDNVESKPLTDTQRLACIRNEDHNLVLAGAGTGKTSTMIGRAGYLLAARLARPDQLLLLAFAKKAAEELQERIVERLGKWSGDTPPKVKTFHALGLEIVGAVEGKKPRLSPLAEDPVAFSRFVDTTLDRCLDNEAYRKRFLYYTQAELFSYRSQFDFTTVGDYQEYV